MLLVFLAAALLSSAPEPTLETLLYREIEAATQHLYKAQCMTLGSRTECTLKVISVSTDKAAAKCSIRVDTLFEDEPAQAPAKGTYSVSVSRGACGYTNTYIFSPNGMVQTKTSPADMPERLRTLGCQTFPPKSYTAKRLPGDTTHFSNVPTGGCSALMVMP